jgi:hypothetical protein
VSYPPGTCRGWCCRGNYPRTVTGNGRAVSTRRETDTDGLPPGEMARDLTVEHRYPPRRHT